jgi:hypothetical protein
LYYPKLQPAEVIKILRILSTDYDIKNKRKDKLGKMVVMWKKCMRKLTD